MAFLCVAILFNGICINGARETCDPDNHRELCGEIAPIHLSLRMSPIAGFFGIQRLECEDRGCCWSTSKSPEGPYCFNKNAGFKHCSTAAHRIPCGKLLELSRRRSIDRQSGDDTVDESTCRARKCCWAEDVKDTKCFFKNSLIDPEQCSTETRVDCGIQSADSRQSPHGLHVGSIGVDRESCEDKGCCWSPRRIYPYEPWCFHQKDSIPSDEPKIIFDRCCPASHRQLCGISSLRIFCYER